MRYLVMVQDEFGVRDAFYAHGDVMQEAAEEAFRMMDDAEAIPHMMVMIPEQDERELPFLFPDDASTDEDLAFGFIRGCIRPVVIDYESSFHLTDGAFTHSNRNRIKRMATMSGIIADSMTHMLNLCDEDQEQSCAE